MLRIAFAGTPLFALPTLRALADSPHHLVGVLTQPDRPQGRGRQLRDSPVKALALQLGLPVYQPPGLGTPEQRSGLVDWMPELLVVVAYGIILPSAVLTLPRLGCLNVHASLLPRWRGAAPIQHAILAGDTETGVSIMLLDEGLDTGPLLAAQRVSIYPTSTAGELQERLARQGAALLLDAIEALESGRARPKAQPEQAVTHAPKIDKRMAKIDWQLPAEQIDRQVRAFNPQPVAQTLWRGAQLRLWEAEVVAPQQAAALQTMPSAASAAPGTVLAVEHGQLWVRCGQGILAITRLQLAGRRVVGAREFANAAAPVGACLGT